MQRSPNGVKNPLRATYLPEGAVRLTNWSVWLRRLWNRSAAARCGDYDPRKPRLFGVSPMWKKAMEGFFHGQSGHKLHGGHFASDADHKLFEDLRIERRGVFSFRVELRADGDPVFDGALDRFNHAVRSTCRHTEA